MLQRGCRLKSPICRSRCPVSAGKEKFQVMEVVESKPVVVAKVKILEDSDDQTLPMTQLSESTVQQFKDLVSLNVKMQSLPVRILVLLPGCRVGKRQWG